APPCGKSCQGATLWRRQANESSGQPAAKSQGRNDMRRDIRWMLGVAMVAAIATWGGAGRAQTTDLPNPYLAIAGWAKLGDENRLGQTISVAIELDGRSIWVFERCGSNTCDGSDVAPIHKFDPSGKEVKRFGAGMFIFPHGLHIDREGNIWVTDGRGKGGKG